MAKDSTTIKTDLAEDLDVFSDVISLESIDPFAILPEELDERDDVTDYHIAISHGTRRPNITIDAGNSYSTIQEYVVQVYLQAPRQKGSEGEFEEHFDDLCDDVFAWINDLGKSNRLYTATSERLRAPRSDEGDLFLDQEEVQRLGKSTYTRFHIETVRKTT